MGAFGKQNSKSEFCKKNPGRPQVAQISSFVVFVDVDVFGKAWAPSVADVSKRQFHGKYVCKTCFTCLLYY